MHLSRKDKGNSKSDIQLRSSRGEDVTSKHLLLYNWAFRCHHNTKSSTTSCKNDRRCKNTYCPSEMRSKLHHTKCQRKRPHSVPFCAEYPCQIDMKYNHNHNMSVLQAYTYRDVKLGVKEEVCNWFEKRKLHH